ncbi:HK97 gp10 family phage protein [Candidatus Saccharibacteria bacterium]|jgi:HK97 gp10 family phage protein|nr:HK97 gp10 family phage protein [Candidatus Saccharibacteria bacterium]
MARCEMKLPDEFMDKLSKLGDKFDSAAPKVLEAGGEVVLSQMKDNLRNVIGKNTKVKSRSTGALEKSLGITPALQDRKGEWNIRVGVGDSRDKKGVPDALKAQVLEYGKAGQPAKPWMKPARRKARKKAISRMEDVLKRELDL